MMSMLRCPRLLHCEEGCGPGVEIVIAEIRYSISNDLK
jgi:hypothetical protein